MVQRLILRNSVQHAEARNTYRNVKTRLCLGFMLLKDIRKLHGGSSFPLGGGTISSPFYSFFVSGSFPPVFALADYRLHFPFIFKGPTVLHFKCLYKFKTTLTGNLAL